MARKTIHNVAESLHAHIKPVFGKNPQLLGHIRLQSGSESAVLSGHSCPHHQLMGGRRKKGGRKEQGEVYGRGREGRK